MFRYVNATLVLPFSFDLRRCFFYPSKSMNLPAAPWSQYSLRARWREWVVCVLLVIGVGLVYGRLFFADFINFDDFEYVKYNVHLRRGFDWQMIKWAFTPGYASNWHPLTWLSHALDVRLFGIKPGPHHLVNILIHAANSVLLFSILNRLTKCFWKSALVVGLFAWHPLHVESVAWISERKDVLSTFFEFCAIGFFTKYACSTNRDGSTWRDRFYWSALGAYALALMCKPMVVTLPFVLLLLDYWPLGRVLKQSDAGSRFDKSKLWLLLSEKLPFFILSAAVCVLTSLAQSKAMVSV